jgi:hypothetical protein
VGPNCALALCGLVSSTLAVTTASGWATAAGWGVGARTLAAEAANVATFGALWVLQFALSDRVLFRSRPAVVPVPAA